MKRFIRLDPTAQRRPSFGLHSGVTLLALACGGSVEAPEQTEAIEPAPTPTPVVRQTCDDNPLLAGCPPSNPTTAPVEDEPAEPAPQGPPSEQQLAQAAAENVLRANCGQCHGPALTPQDARAGMNYIESLPRLVQEGKLVPLDSANSAIVRRMRDGSMPPVGSNGPRPSDQDIDLVASFIDNPVFWPNERRPVTRDCSLEPVVTLDQLFAQLQQDLLRQDADDREFIRYISLVNRANAGLCSEELQGDRSALLKGLNMTSTRSRVSVPTAVDRTATVYRIDLRNYGWDREVEVEGRQFDDAWEAIIDESPYAVPFAGDEADFLRQQMGTDVVLMNSDALLDSILVGELYYALIGVDAGGSLTDLVEDELGIDVQDNIDDKRVVRAGTTQSVISRQDRVVERHDIEVRSGVYWQSFDFAANQAGESIFDEPFAFNQGGTEAIFSLPNGFLAYVIADANDEIVTESNILFDTLQNDFVARTSVSCSGCHARGFLPVVDQVRPFAELNPFVFNADDFKAVRDLYPTPAEFSRIIEDDSRGFQNAMERAGLVVSARDPVSEGFLRFDRDVDLRTAAGELFVDRDLLTRQLPRLDPALSVLPTTTLDRDDFTARYAESLCLLQGFSRNGPDRDFCDDVLRNR